MKIVPIFAPYLTAIAFDDDDDELVKFINFLTDAEGLFEYFTENENVLEYENITIDEAIEFASDYGEQLYDLLESQKENLDTLFTPLNKKGNNEPCLYRMKHRMEWIRIYAIQVESQFYIITGGAIKQSKKMQEHPLTEKELNKMQRVREFLISQGITDIDGYMELINE